jgi:hypothetical protein
MVRSGIGGSNISASAISGESSHGCAWLGAAAQLCPQNIQNSSLFAYQGAGPSN